jgi:hypothetical protein
MDWTGGEPLYEKCGLRCIHVCVGHLLLGPPSVPVQYNHLTETKLGQNKRTLMFTSLLAPFAFCAKF